MPSRVRDQDQPMQDAGSQPQNEQDQANAPLAEEEDMIEINEQRIKILSSSTDTAASFQFDGEDHTLGNALRYVIMKNPEVEFCGYTIPHPSEAKMNLRIQTYDTTNVFDVLEKGFDDLMNLCDAVTEKFTDARDTYEANK